MDMFVKPFRLLLVPLTLALFFISTTSAVAGTQLPNNDVHLQLAIWEFGAWTRPMSSESPLFALYSDGTVIFDNGVEDYHPIYFCTKLNLDEQQRILNKLAVLHSAAYSTSSASDQPTSYMWWRDAKENPNDISVYGHLYDKSFHKGYGPLTIRSSLLGNRPEQPIPTEFIELFDELKHYKKSNAKRWLPSKIEVMISPAYSPKRHLWPAGWPDLHDKYTRKWPNSEYNYSIYLPARYFPRFLKMMKQAPFAKINDDPYSLEYRFPFPDEDATYSKRE